MPATAQVRFAASSSAQLPADTPVMSGARQAFTTCGILHPTLPAIAAIPSAVVPPSSQVAYKAVPAPTAISAAFHKVVQRIAIIAEQIVNIPSETTIAHTPEGMAQMVHMAPTPVSVAQVPADTPALLCRSVRHSCGIPAIRVSAAASSVTNPMVSIFLTVLFFRRLPPGLTFCR